MKSPVYQSVFDGWFAGGKSDQSEKGAYKLRNIKDWVRYF